MKNKFLAFVMVMAMALTMIPGVAMAAGVMCTDSACSHEAAIINADDTVKAHYENLRDAIVDATSGQTVKLLKDITVDNWVSDSTTIPTLTGKDGITIDGDGHSLTVNTISSQGNGNYLMRNAKNTTIKNLKVTAPNGFSIASGTVENCVITTDAYGLSIGSNVTIKGCTFNKCSHAIYTKEDGSGTNVVITGNTFNCKRATILRSDEQFTGNTLTDACTSGVTVSSSAASTVTGNTFEKGSRLKLYLTPAGSTAAPIISGNTIGGSVEVEGGGAYDITGNTITETANVPDNVTHDPVTTTKPASSYSGPNIWYEGGNTFGTSTTQVPTEVKIDGVVVPFTMNGSKVTVGCVNPNADWVTVKWGSTTNTINFTPDAAAECTTVAIPKTGDMPIWAAVLAFFGF